MHKDRIEQTFDVMVILSGYQQAIHKLTDAQVAFVARLTTVTSNLSISLIPPVNHYTLKFEKTDFQCRNSQRRSCRCCHITR